MMKYRNTLVGRELQASGLFDIEAKLLAGEPLTTGDEARIQTADVLLVSAVADALREQYAGDDVLLYATRAPVSDQTAHVVRPSHLDRTRWTGLDFMRLVAHARIVTPKHIAVAVCWDDVGIELAQVALTAGAHVLFGVLPSQSHLPVVSESESMAVSEKSKRSKAQSPRVEISGLVQRAGRRAVWVDEPHDIAQVADLAGVDGSRANHEVAR